MSTWLDLIAQAPGRNAAALLLALPGMVVFVEEPRSRRRAAGLALVAALGAAVGLGVSPLWSAGAILAALTARPRDPLQTECAVKLLWVLGPAVALSWTGHLLLVFCTGADRPAEQWSVLALGLDAPALWATGVALSLLLALVLLGVPPFHFWLADLMQGGRVWMASAAVVALQWAGAAALSARLAGAEAFPDGADAARTVVRVAVAAGLIAGALTLLVQRRPERRVGTLASLHGTLAAAGFIAGEPPDAAWLARWGAHLALVLPSAALLARFVPVAVEDPSPGVLARKHPWTLAAGFLPWFSLAGVPGTPGSLLWLEAGHRLLRAGYAGFLLVLAGAWAVALGAAFAQAREAYGIPSRPAPEGNPVPLAPRLALWVAAIALLWMSARGTGP